MTSVFVVSNLTAFFGHRRLALQPVLFAISCILPEPLAYDNTKGRRKEKGKERKGKEKTQNNLSPAIRSCGTPILPRSFTNCSFLDFPARSPLGGQSCLRIPIFRPYRCVARSCPGLSYPEAEPFLLLKAPPPRASAPYSYA